MKKKSQLAICPRDALPPTSSSPQAYSEGARRRSHHPRETSTVLSPNLSSTCSSQIVVTMARSPAWNIVPLFKRISATTSMTWPVDSRAKLRRDCRDPDSHVAQFVIFGFVHHRARKPSRMHRKRPGSSWSTGKTTSFSWICNSVHRWLRGGSQATICAAETSTLCSLVCCGFKIRSWRWLG